MEHLALFFAVSLMSTATPGPAVLYVTSQGVAGGMRSAVSSSLGILAADGLYILLSVTGLTTLLVTSYELFTILRWAGAIYLVYLGLRYVWMGITAPAPAGRVEASPSAPMSSKAFLGGFALHAANPKALLYFGSLVPQFVDPQKPLGPQLTALALVHLATASSVLLAYSAASSRFRRSGPVGYGRRLFHIGTGSLMVGAGVGLALARRAAR